MASTNTAGGNVSGGGGGAAVGGIAATATGMTSSPPTMAPNMSGMMTISLPTTRPLPPIYHAKDYHFLDIELKYGFLQVQMTKCISLFAKPNQLAYQSLTTYF